MPRAAAPGGAAASGGGEAREDPGPSRGPASSGDGRGEVGGEEAWGRREGGRLPVYPAAARRRGWEGTVRLEILTDASGAVESVSVEESSGHAVLDDAAVEAARTWTFKPLVKDGQALPGRVRIPVVFRLTK